ncbi:MAG: hypothetical protein M1822_006136 [Bathelium mastoideum]|nr:MAG: hypothetical protein M1822_006136 [Bathelium mastoideum]
MDQRRDKWLKLVFRVRGLPNTIKNHEGVSELLGERLGDIRPDSIHVFSLATTLTAWEPSKVATVMFASPPGLLQETSVHEWPVPSRNLDERLILDTHFMGMTPLNDIDAAHHVADCIAISGLASHPFGSWQPKEANKTFMWVRDGLPRHLRGTRAILYGYDTKLNDSQSFQRISDLAQALVISLQTYGWNDPFAKNIAFLAHSLGGLVLKAAITQLAQSQDESLNHLLGIIKGAVFFGVPSYGMEQAHFRTVVRENPNEALVDDIGRNSNYLRRLNESFKSLSHPLKCFWAFETLESPTLVQFPDGKIDRNGPPNILVSRASATCGFVDTNPSVTVPIHATHSDMVKFRPDSEYYHTVVSKLINILSLLPTSDRRADDSSRSQDQLASYSTSSSSAESLTRAFQNPSRRSLRAELESFKRTTALAEADIVEIESTTLVAVKQFLCNLHEKQEQNGNMTYLRRLDAFLMSMEEYCSFVEAIEIFDNPLEAAAYLWGPMRYILNTSSKSSEALNYVLDAYQDIGEQIPPLHGLEDTIGSSPHMREVLLLMFKDILAFQGQTIQHFRQRTDLTQFQAIQSIRNDVNNVFERERKTNEDLHRLVVKQWLSATDCEAQQNRHRNTRSICPNAGSWLLEHPRFQQWFSPDYCTAPLLWLNGIPGAGKTILASVVVDAVREISDVTLAFFYCKHSDPTRNSFITVARSILAQTLDQDPRLLSYFHEMASTTDSAVLSSVAIAKRMLETSFNSCGKIYVIIDGLDECERGERKNISTWLQGIIQELPTEEMNSLRCLIISQDDATTRKDLKDFSAIKMTTENHEDLRRFTAEWQKRIERRFGDLRPENRRLANTIFARAQGMFVFAELLAKFLENLPSREDLFRELDPAKFPVKLDHVYERIIDRVFELRDDAPVLVDRIRQVLGWIVCAQRPLQWREIQGAICIDIDQQCVNYDRSLVDSPKALFASLVELEDDGTVDLVHGSARE